MLEFDTIVVGLGLAGASASISLAQRGARVLALESGAFPRRKVCGEFLSPESRATLGRLQVLERVLASGARDVARTRIFAPHNPGKTPRALEANLPSPGLAISRWELDRLLFERAQEAGVRVETSTRVSRIEPPKSDCEPWKIHAGGREFACKYLLASSGRGAPWWKKDDGPHDDGARFVGLKAHFAGANVEGGVVELHAWDGGYCGLARVENGAVNACLLARYESLDGRSPGEFWGGLLEDLPALRSRMRGSELLFPWQATANVRFCAPTPLRALASTCEPVMCAGDAAGFIHPLTGDGMAMALRSGELAAASIAIAAQNGWARQELNALWRGSWEREFAARLKWSRALQSMLINPNLSRWARPVLAAAPGLVQVAIRRTRGAAAST